MEQQTRTLTVIERKDEAVGVISLTLAAADGAPLPEWAPGAHIDLILPNGLVRQYSLCSDPADLSNYRIGVLREPESRGGSEWIHEHLTEGASIDVSDPRNNFPLHTAPHYRFVAGGIGITPILPMLEQADGLGASWSLLYGGRTRSSMAFLDALEKYGDKVTISPQDEYGILDLTSRFTSPLPGELIYACGPEPMLVAAENACTDWEEGSLNIERFVPKVIETDGADESFEVEFVDSGITVTVPADRTILDLAEDNGINVFSSCREGTCGTCETPILEGEADHRDSLLTPSEMEAQQSMFICVSRAKRGCSKLKLAL